MWIIFFGEYKVGKATLTPVTQFAPNTPSFNTESCTAFLLTPLPALSQCTPMGCSPPLEMFFLGTPLCFIIEIGVAFLWLPHSESPPNTLLSTSLSQMPKEALLILQKMGKGDIKSTYKLRFVDLKQAKLKYPTTKKWLNSRLWENYIPSIKLWLWSDCNNFGNFL